MMQFTSNERKFDTIQMTNSIGATYKVNRFMFRGVPLTIRQIASVLEKSVACVYGRICSGYSPDAKFLRRGVMPKRHTFDGKTMTVKEIALAFGIPTYKVYNTFNKCAKKHMKVSLEMFVK